MQINYFKNVRIVVKNGFLNYVMIFLVLFSNIMDCIYIFAEIVVNAFYLTRNKKIMNI